MVSASDYVSSVALSIGSWVPQPFVVLGTDGFGRSEARKELRRFFEVDAENVALAALGALADQGKFPDDELPAAVKTLRLDPNKPNPVAV